MAFIEVTALGTALPKQLFDISTIKRIVPTTVGSHIIFEGANPQTFKCTETLATIFAQQNTAGKAQGMLLISNTDSGLQSIETTHNIDEIHVEGTGSRVIFKDQEPSIKATETQAALFAFQGSSTKLGMINVTRTKDSKVFLYFTKDIEKIVQVTSTPDTSRIIFKDAKAATIVNGTATAIYAAQP